ncbi:YceD family protein [Candidatus Symbiobacter mobilis]|uniref:Large ribosomal RNA subunit accumulation protein YceD n=1 Tax=Candidatus Symbiobacter mobilis CR TaxID=946483 RepID=U5NBE7_9BURK|nr:DUF177 domain-containing protein [Candidatus Symbiobacter mobilis]AGX88645.1 hypothetical protein Cenrod_2593 [Candidatus Symbiobacter mobilis CR]
MSKHPPRIDLRRAAEALAPMEGVDTLAAFPRLLEATESQGADRAMHWQAHLSCVRQRPTSPAVLWLHLQVAVCLPLPCQRCLTPVDTLIEIDRHFRFVHDEATAEREDPDCEEDILVLSVPFDLSELVEDEVLLALPLSPRHEDCTLRTMPDMPNTKAAPGDDEEPHDNPHEEPPNPFGVLARWKQ